MPGYTMANYYRRKANAIAYLGGRCVDCETTVDLQFHHRDPADKEFTIVGHLGYRWEIVEAELKKCDLLCESCHVKRHRAMRPERVLKHGTYNCYNKDRCRCGACRKANADRVARQRAIYGRSSYNGGG